MAQYGSAFSAEDWTYSKIDIDYERRSNWAITRLIVGFSYSGSRSISEGKHIREGSSMALRELSYNSTQKCFCISLNFHVTLFTLIPAKFCAMKNQIHHFMSIGSSHRLWWRHSERMSLMRPDGANSFQAPYRIELLLNIKSWCCCLLLI